MTRTSYTIQWRNRKIAASWNDLLLEFPPETMKELREEFRRLRSSRSPEGFEFRALKEVTKTTIIK